MSHSYPNRPPARIVGLCGSLRRDSSTCRAVEYALQGARQSGAEVQLIDLRDYALVFFGSVAERDYPDDVFKLRREISQAHSIIIGTPEYHGSLSGVLKNALDLMGANEFEGKILGLVGVAGGSLGAGKALGALRTIGQNLRAWVLPQEVSIAESHKIFDPQGRLLDDGIRTRLRQVGQEAVEFAMLHVHRNAAGPLAIPPADPHMRTSRSAGNGLPAGRTSGSSRIAGAGGLQSSCALRRVS